MSNFVSILLVFFVIFNLLIMISLKFMNIQINFVFLSANKVRVQCCCITFDIKFSTLGQLLTEM